MVEIVFYSVLLALLIVALYVAVRVAKTYIERVDDDVALWHFEDHEPGKYIVYRCGGRHCFERLASLSFSPTFYYDEEAKMLFFERSDGCTFRVRVDEWYLVDVPERED